MLMPPLVLARSRVRGAARARRRFIHHAFSGGTQLVSVAAESNYVQLSAKAVTGNGYEAAYQVTATLNNAIPEGATTFLVQ